MSEQIPTIDGQRTPFPPGSLIAHTDYFHYLGHVVRRLRIDFDLKPSD